MSDSIKVFTLAPKEDWIVDRFVKEWNEDNADVVVAHPKDATHVWLMAGWCAHQLSATGHLRGKKILSSIHHVVPEKWDQSATIEFAMIDSFTTAYHVPNIHTRDFIAPLTKKQIYVVPYWGNQKIWRKTGDKYDMRAYHGLPQDKFLIGSFQRDTEGNGIERGIFNPKLEKGPDLLADYVIQLKNDWNAWMRVCGTNAGREPHVVLAGWRRQYIISRLEAAGIPYSYFERPSQEIINELYQTLDLYPVSARHEGGPQALIECGLLNIPVVSRNVGMASQLLPKSSICDNLLEATPNIPVVDHLKLPLGYKTYRRLLESL